MLTISTFVYIFNHPGKEDKVTELNELFKAMENCDDELEEILGIFDYAPSEEVIDRILEYAYST